MVAYSVVSVILILLADSPIVFGGAGTDWGYHDGIRPACWPLVYPTCNGRKQSPINIQTRKAKVDKRLGLFDFSDLHSINNVRLTMENNGHTVVVDVEGSNMLYIKGGGIPGRYIVKQWHYHWGSIDSRGSEHDINGKFFPMEMHVVTYSARFISFEKAQNEYGGLAVLAFLFDIGNDNPAFEEVISHLSQIRHKDDHVDIKTFDLSALFPKNSDVFYRYYGGLTTPQCYESVIWTVFKEHIKISERQINQFRLLSDRHIQRFVAISDNFRPTQPLNDRTVYTNDRRGLAYSRPNGQSSSSQSSLSLLECIAEVLDGERLGFWPYILPRSKSPFRYASKYFFSPHYGRSIINGLGSDKVYERQLRNSYAYGNIPNFWTTYKSHRKQSGRKSKRSRFNICA